MTEAREDDAKSNTAELLGIRLGRATEHVMWILLSIWFFLEALPSYDDGSQWEGPVSWFSSLWVEAGLPGNSLTDIGSGVWSAFDSEWAVWLFILLSAGTCGLAVGHPEKWGLRALSYLGVAGAVEAAGAFWPALAAPGALFIIAVVAVIRCWIEDRNPAAENYLDYASPAVVVSRFVNDVALHYILPLLGPVVLLLFTLQNFWAGAQYRPTEDLLQAALRNLRKPADAPLNRKDVLSALEVLISLNGASRRESSSLASWALAQQRVPSGAMLRGNDN